MRSVLFTFLLLAGLSGFGQGFSFFIPPFDSSEQVFLPRFPRYDIDKCGFVGVDSSGSFVVNGAPIKFWGSNLVTDGAFPTKAQAPLIAARMRKMGFNLMRHHHLDNCWGSLGFFYQMSNTQSYNTQLLDRWQYFIAEMKKQGIYMDMNLLVSRQFKKSDGVAGADSLTDFSYWKTPALFDPQLIKLEKEYAHTILTLLNPYTGKSLVDDPVMAMVEIVNENSIFRSWIEGTLKPMKQGGTMLYRHSRMLDSLWNAFLVIKYTTNQRLDSAWQSSSASSPTNMITNGDFENRKTSPWQVEVSGSSAGTFSADTTTAAQGTCSGKLDETKHDGTDWHFQLKQTNLSIDKDTIYQVLFWAKAASDVSMNVTVSLNISPWESYSWNTFQLGTSWQQYKVSLKAAKTVSKDVRLLFNLTAKTTVWIDSVWMGKPPVVGLMTGEDLALKNISRIDYADRYQYSPQRVKDMVAFYLDLQGSFLTMMKAFLKDSVGVKVPISGTNWYAGPEDVFINAGMDYLDNHAYWDHPTFPATPWSGTEWYISNDPMVKNTTLGTIPALFSGYQLKNKPYTISEYNHAYPNQYQSEMLPVITGYSSLNGADALMFFDYNSTQAWNTDVVNGYFDIDRNDVIMSASPVFAYAFRNNLIGEATATVEANYTTNDIYTFPLKNDAPVWDLRLPFSKKLALTSKVVVGNVAGQVSVFNQQFPAEPTPPHVSQTGECSWDPAGLYTINTRRLQSISGQLDDNEGETLSDLALVEANAFGSLSWLSLDSNSLYKSKKSLVVLNASQVNTGMTWDYATYTGNATVKNNWGRAPSLQNPVSVTIKLHVKAAYVKVFVLDPTGAASADKSQLYAPSGDEEFTVSLDQAAGKSLWFGIETYHNDSVLSAIPVNGADAQISISPNPASDMLAVSCSACNTGDAKIELSTSTGIVVRNATVVTKSNSFTVNIDVKALPPGLYFCSCTTGRTTTTVRKIVIK